MAGEPAAAALDTHYRGQHGVALDVTRCVAVHTLSNHAEVLVFLTHTQDEKSKKKRTTKAKTFVIESEEEERYRE